MITTGVSFEDLTIGLLPGVWVNNRKNGALAGLTHKPVLQRNSQLQRAGVYLRSTNRAILSPGGLNQVSCKRLG